MFRFDSSLRAEAASAAVLLLTVPARAQETGNRPVIVALPEVFPAVLAPPGVSVLPGIPP